MADEHHDLFISYSPDDKPWVSEFVAALRKERLHPFWYAEIAPGEKWQEAIEQALRESGTFIMVLSPQSLQSHWMFFELGAAIADKKKIIPVTHEDIEWSQVPPMLRRYQFLDEPSPSLAGKRVAEVVGKQRSMEIPAEGAA